MEPTDLLGKDDEFPGGGKTGGTILGLPERNVKRTVKVIELHEARDRGRTGAGTPARATP
jgi:hypothetical protein